MGTKNKRLSIVFTMLIVLILFSCEKNVSTSPPIEPVPLGCLFVDSSPKGMKIYEDGRNSGRITPDTLNWLDARQYEITLKKELFLDTTIVVEVLEDEKKNLLVNYYTSPQMLGGLQCLSHPSEAAISINDSLTEFLTPYTFTGLLPGEYKVTIDLDNYRSKSVYKRVQSSVNTTVDIYLQDTSKWVDYNTSNSSTPIDYMSKVVMDKDGRLWMIAAELGLVSCLNYEWTLYTLENSPIDEFTYVSDLAIDDDNTLWVGTYNGLYSKKDGVWELYDVHNSDLQSDAITCLYFDNGTKRLWIGTKKGAYSRNENGTWNTIRKFKAEDSVININLVNEIFCDSRGNIWIGAGIQGLLCVVEEEERQILKYHIHGFGSNLTCIIEEYDAGRIWFGFLGTSRMKTYNFSTEQFYEADIWLPTLYVNNSYYDSSGNVWICTENGVVKLTDTYRLFFPNWSIRGLVEDAKNGLMWIVTYGAGIIKLKEF